MVMITVNDVVIIYCTYPNPTVELTPAGLFPQILIRFIIVSERFALLRKQAACFNGSMFG